MLETIDRNPTWQSEFKEAFKTSNDLEKFLDTSIPHTPYPLFVPQRLAIKIKKAGPESALWKQFVPVKNENSEQGLADPIGDKTHFKTGQLIHRYQNRALFMPTSVCPVLCRYCFRKNELGIEKEIFTSDLSETTRYLKAHPEINEIIFSGGDPFILSNDKLELYLEYFLQFSHIRFIRFHTRTPIILPSRIDEGLIHLLQKYNQLFSMLTIVVHANHSSEFDDEVNLGLKKLSESGVQLLSQSVLLKGVNDREEDLVELIEQLINLKIRPYYLHHPDQVKGGMHFYLNLEDGRKIYHGLRRQIPGWALPQYIIDIPGGQGKTLAMNPEHFHFSGELISSHGESITLKDPLLH